jgi:hypothetical protein
VADIERSPLLIAVNGARACVERYRVSGNPDLIATALQELDDAAEHARGAVEALLEAVALLDALVDPDDLPLDVGDRLDSVRRASRRLGGQ